jgi:hypothetical protein
MQAFEKMQRPSDLVKPMDCSKVKSQKRLLLQQKKAEYVTILIDMLSICSCYVYYINNSEFSDHIFNCLNEIWPLSKIPIVFRYNAAQRLDTRTKPMR